MRNRLTFYPLIRREFETVRELSEVINRSESYCKKRLNGQLNFTHKDKTIIANYLNVEITEVTR